ncbi:S26 family signal peptidase [Phytomonospora sp. NPDC050363]|uniref:S26 family signal peptidase n=1 Tax=Phytomonospora sp. NPDC050363 TaxID=3155642 RepID=UPI0033E4FCC0
MPFWAVVLAASLLALVGALWWARRRFVMVDVDGSSMSPAYLDGDTVLVRRTGRVRAGQVVAFIPRFEGGAVPSPGGGRLWLLKRVAAGPGDAVPPGLGPALLDLAGEPVPADGFVALGDNRVDSYDSRHEGLVALGRVRGVVVRKL